MKSKKEIFAVWEVDDLPTEDNCGETGEMAALQNQCHVSCGVGDDQWDGFFLESDKGAKLVIEHVRASYYRITFTAPAQDLADHKDYWLSPNTLGANEIEAVDFGMREIK